jgi:hypothetical protein
MLGGPVYLSRFTKHASILVDECSWAAEPALRQVYLKYADYREREEGWKLPQDDPLYDECVKVATDLFLLAYYSTAKWRLPSDAPPLQDPGMDMLRCSRKAEFLHDVATRIQDFQEFLEPLLALIGVEASVSAGAGAGATAGFGSGSGPRGAAQDILKAVAMKNAHFNYKKCALT